MRGPDPPDLGIAPYPFPGRDSGPEHTDGPELGTASPAQPRSDVSLVYTAYLGNKVTSPTLLKDTQGDPGDEHENEYAQSRQIHGAQMQRPEGGSAHTLRTQGARFQSPAQVLAVT